MKTQQAIAGTGAAPYKLIEPHYVGYIYRGKDSEPHFLQDIETDGAIPDQPVPPKRLSSNGLTGFDMLDVVVPFTIADAVCDTDFAVGRMSENVDAFGVVGHDAVVKFKDDELVSVDDAIDASFDAFH